MHAQGAQTWPTVGPQYTILDDCSVAHPQPLFIYLRPAYWLFAFSAFQLPQAHGFAFRQDDPVIMTPHVGPVLFVDGSQCKDGVRSSLCIPWLVQPKKATLIRLFFLGIARRCDLCSRGCLAGLRSNLATRGAMLAMFFAIASVVVFARRRDLCTPASQT